MAASANSWFWHFMNKEPALMGSAILATVAIGFPLVVPQMRQAISSEQIDYNKPLTQRTPELYHRIIQHKDLYSPTNRGRPDEPEWDADVLMRYHSSKEGEYRSVGAPQTSTNAAMRTLPKGTSGALRAELLKLTEQDAASDVGTTIMFQSPVSKMDPIFPLEMGWRSGTLAAEGPEETPAQAHVSALRQAAQSMVREKGRVAEIMATRAHDVNAATKEGSFRTAERRLQRSVQTVTQPKEEQ